MSRGAQAGVEGRRTAISVEGLTYSYPRQGRPAVDNVSFEVAEGEIFGLLGPSGAGKTTTQRVLTRQQRTFVGEACVLGRPLAQWGQEYFEEIGVGFELPNHYVKFTAIENLSFFASLYTKKSRDPMELLRLVGLEAAADKKVEEFSKGMRMRLTLSCLSARSEALVPRRADSRPRPRQRAHRQDHHQRTARPRKNDRAHDAQHE